LQNRLILTSETGGQWYSDTSLFSIPCPVYVDVMISVVWFKCHFRLNRPKQQQIKYSFETFKKIFPICSKHVKQGAIVLSITAVRIMTVSVKTGH
jgi:hypothetical protein